jgi:fructose-specific phosphotransferase system IIA component
VEIRDYIHQQYINLSILSDQKDDAIREVAQLLQDAPGVIDYELFLADIFEREQLGTTGIGEGIAIPHARSDGIAQFVIALGRSPKGVEFESLDGRKAELIFLMGTPKGRVSDYLKILAQLTRVLKQGPFREKLLEVNGSEQVLELFREMKV